PELTLLRQGEGDFRLRYPPRSAYGTTATILSGVVQRTLRAALSGSYSPDAHLGLRFDAGVHHISNYGHVTGQTQTKFVGSVGLTRSEERRVGKGCGYGGWVDEWVEEV